MDMYSLHYDTVDNRVSVEYSEDPDRIDCIKVSLNEKVIAKFGIAEFWDMMVSILSNVKPENRVGIERRQYEAKNIGRLTKEYIDRKSV